MVVLVVRLEASSGLHSLRISFLCCDQEGKVGSQLIVLYKIIRQSKKKKTLDSHGKSVFLARGY